MDIRNLPYAVMDLSGGIASNIRPEETVGKWLTQGQNVDTFDEYRSAGKVPGGTRVSPHLGSGLRGLHHFEFTDLDGVRKRHQLASTQGGLFVKINSSSSSTTLTSGLYGEQLRDANVLNRLYLTGPNQYGLATGGMVYDGTRITNWGLLAPGQTQTVAQALASADAGSWTGSTDVTVSAETSATRGGSGSVAMAKTGTSSTAGYIERASLSLNWSGLERAGVWVFLPSGCIQKLATSGTAVQVRYGGNSLTNSNSHNFTVGQLVPGWNLLSLTLTSPSSTSGTGASLAAITTIRLGLTFSGNSQTQSGIFWSKFFTYDLGKCTAAQGAAGNVTGTRSYKVVFVGERGNTSNGGEISNSVTVTSKIVSLTAVPVSADPQCIARWIYADVNGDRLYRFVGQIDDNVTTTFSDNIADAGLGSNDLGLAGDTNFDYSTFGQCRDIAYYAGRIFGIDALNPTQLLVGDLNNPESRRLIDEISMDVEMVALRVHPLGLMIYSTDAIFVVRGDGVNTPFDPIQATDQFGCNGVRSVTQIKSIHIAAREEDVYAVVNPTEPWPLNGVNRDVFEDIDPASLKDAFWIVDRRRFRVFGFIQNVPGAEYDRFVVYQYGTAQQGQVSDSGSGIDPHDVRIGSWWTADFPSSWNPQCAVIAERSSDKPELWVGCNDGYVYWIGDPSSTSWPVQETSPEAIESIIETTAVRLGSGEGSRGVPRFLKVHADCPAQSTWTMTATLLSDVDGQEIATVSRSIVFPAGKSSPLVPIPYIGARGEWCRIKLTNSTVGEGGRFRLFILYYIPRGDFRGPREA